MFVSVHLFTVANADYFPQTRQRKRKSGLRWLWWAGRTNQNSSWNNPRHKAHKEGKVAGRGEGKGEKSSADCWSVFVMASHTYKHTNSPWRASPCHSLPNHARLISCQSFCTAVLKRGTGHEERAHEMDEGMVVKLVKLLPSTIKLPLCNAILTWHIKRSESRPASSFSLPEQARVCFRRVKPANLTE